MTDNIYLKLAKIQNALNIPKSRLNKFAQKPFYYRNAEDILNAAKPVCLEHGLLLYCYDKPISIDGWHYIEAHAVLTDGTDTIEVMSSAREDEAKKGFDCSQLSGSASSYARKYALNGLFDLDDNQDTDSQDNSTKQENTPKKDDILICSDCGKPITIQEHDWSAQHFNKILCRNCQQVRAKKR